MGVKFSPIGNDVMFFSTDGLVAAGGQLFFYEANTTTKQNTYTTNSGAVANSNPIVLDSYGKSTNQIWLTEGESYKVVLAPAGDTDPPASGVVLGDYITGINDTGTISIDQWILYDAAPTYVSATQFTLADDQTSTFHVGRRLKSTNTGGTIYSTITASSYSAPNTTITVVNDSGNLDSGLSAVSYGILSSTNPSVPKIALPDGSTAVTQSQGDNSTKIATTAYVDGLTTQHYINGLRLTLTSGTPVTTSDVTGATTIYATPYRGNQIGLYNGSSWDMVSTAEISLALGTLTNDNCYDVFCYSNSGTATLEFLAWTNKTTRATAIALQDGVLVKSGDATRRYLGTFLTTSTTETEDSEDKRYLWNYYNRAERVLNVVDSTATWSYSSATWRQANAASTNQIDFIMGVIEEPVTCQIYSNVSTDTSGGAVGVSFGLNSTSTPTGRVAGGVITTAVTQLLHCEDYIYPSTVGYNYIAWLEYSAGAGTDTWYGTSGLMLSGIWATIKG